MTPARSSQDKIDALVAAEIALGLVSPEAAQDVEAADKGDAQVLCDIQAWSARLMPLNDEITAVVPPARVWASLDHKLQFQSRGIERRLKGRSRQKPSALRWAVAVLLSAAVLGSALFLG
ncbi:MAG: hypothetical protein AAGD04_00835 [Pseudomonadota bacterium]